MGVPLAPIALMAEKMTVIAKHMVLKMATLWNLLIHAPMAAGRAIVGKVGAVKEFNAYC